MEPTVESAPLLRKGGTFVFWEQSRNQPFNPAGKCADTTYIMTNDLLLAEACQPVTAPDPITHSSEGKWVPGHLSRRRWPIVLTVVFCIAGILYMFFWNLVAHHANNWAIGGDVWGIYRGAHFIGWGSLGGIYTNGTGIVAFPGMSVLLTPLALVTWHLHMTESYGPYFLAHPSVALVLQPVELLLASTVIFASDALAERLGVVKRRRFWLCVVVAVIAFPTAALWGHAEDSLAVTFALYAMLAMMDEKWTAMGWLFGFGIVMQPLVGLMIPLFIGATPQGQRFMLFVRSAAISAVLVGVAFLGDAADTYRQLVQQPTPPSVNHATPWASVAPKLTSSAVQTVHGASLVAGLGHAAISSFTATGTQLVEVSGGPGRMIDVVLAVLLGFVVWRRPQTQVRILWLAAVVLASRCFFEPVMTPYYLAPPLIMCMVIAARQPRKRFWPSVVIALEITVFAYHHLNPWVWWVPIVGGLFAILALSYPGDSAQRPETADLDHSAVAAEPVDSSADSLDVDVDYLEREPALH